MITIFKKTSSYNLFLIILLVIIPIVDCFIQISHIEYFIATIGLWGVFIFLFHKIKTIEYHRLDVLVFLFVAYELIHFLLFSKSCVLSLFFWKRITFFALYCVLRTLYNIYGQAFLKHLVIIFCLKAFFEMTLGVLQYLSLFNSHRSDFFTIIGTFTTPNYFAYILCIGLLVSIWFLFNNNKKTTIPFTTLIIAANGITVGLLITTKSRTALVAFLVSVLYFFIKAKSALIKKLKLSAKALIIVSICFCVFLGSNLLYNYKKDSADGRLFVAKITLNEVKAAPVFGHGVFSFEHGYNSAKATYFKAQEREWEEVKVGDYVYAAMNDYLQILYETGFVGLLLLLLIIAVVFSKACKSDYAFLGRLLFGFFIVTALFSSVHRNDNLMVLAITSFILCQDGSLSKKLILKNVQLHSIKKLVVIFFFSTILFVASIKLYTKELILSSIQNKETINLIPKGNWKKWAYITSNNGLSDFAYGHILYKYYGEKQEGLKIMQKAASKNIKPSKIRSLAKCYIKEKKYALAKELLLLNKYTQPFRYEPKMDLIKLYKKTSETDFLCKNAIEVINFPVKIPSEKVTAYKRISTKIVRNCK